ncbi:tagaturonate reductase [Pedobacter nanyangensis]|uniref:tagaturonate reductase n=1 Tax=Pedobacter nanyangensis TaxID=1562389 RepID=UPI000DE23910|nr:tagaturonate reductase [Pedobacter nanyangensis]
MKLSRSTFAEIAGSVELPGPEVFNLPEKVLQFGTGVLLRGLPDHYIDQANKQGVFNGRVVVVKSTDKGDTKDFEEQNSLYTLCVRGIENGKKVHEDIVNASVSRVLNANEQWETILDFAASSSLELIISNTTEAGIAFVDENVLVSPPISFPGKLVSVLYHRFKMYNGARDKGLVIIPTELIADNGDKLKEIVLKLAVGNKLPSPFLDWLRECNTFCNSLVDRIVPGKPDEETLQAQKDALGYEDGLLIMAEAYSLWAIQGDEKIKSKLTFATVDKGVIITPDIDLHRELKLRLLNGTHTLSCAVAFLAGFGTVKQAMEDENMEAFIAGLMKSEIASAIPYQVPTDAAIDFSDKVLDRFRNPHIKHQWLSISMNYTSKLKARVVPLLKRYAELFHKAPELMAFGFASYIRFIKAEKIDGLYYGKINGTKYLINDDKIEHIYQLFLNNEGNIVQAILKDTALWDTDLSMLPGFEALVNGFYLTMANADTSVKEQLMNIIENKIDAL